MKSIYYIGIDISAESFTVSCLEIENKKIDSRRIPEYLYRFHDELNQGRHYIWFSCLQEKTTDP